MEFSINGLDEVTKKLEKLQEGIEELEGENQVPFDELFPPEFMEKYTSFESIEQMLEESDFKLDTNNDFENLPDKDWDEYVAKNTQFDTWNSMLEEASTEWVSKKLGFS
jgi:hypothetical protein